MAEQPNRRGGRRAGAGRKAKAGQPTVVKRIPVGLVETVERLIDRLSDHAGKQPAVHNDNEFFLPAEHPEPLSVPLAVESIQAGFPSPAEPSVDRYLDFNEYLVANRAATIIVRCGGESMHDAGIGKGDLLVIDRSKTPKNHDIVMADVGNEYTVKRLCRESGRVWLRSENASGSFPDFAFGEGDELSIVGVVTHVIKSF